MIQFMGNVGSAANGNATVVTVSTPAAGIPVGTLLFCRGWDATAATTLAVTDARSNTYTQRASSTTTRSAFVHTCLVTTALVSGDLITFTFVAKNAIIAVVDAFIGVNNTADSSGTANGTSTTPSAAFSHASAGLVLAHVGVVGATTITYTEDPDNVAGDSWHTLTRVAQASAYHSNGAYKIPSFGTTETYDPVLGSSAFWVELLAGMTAEPSRIPGGAERIVVAPAPPLPTVVPLGL